MKTRQVAFSFGASLGASRGNNRVSKPPDPAGDFQSTRGLAVGFHMTGKLPVRRRGLEVGVSRERIRGDVLELKRGEAARFGNRPVFVLRAEQVHAAVALARRLVIGVLPK